MAGESGETGDSGSGTSGTRKIGGSIQIEQWNGSPDKWQRFKPKAKAVLTRQGHRKGLSNSLDMEEEVDKYESDDMHG